MVSAACASRALGAGIVIASEEPARWPARGIRSSGTRSSALAALRGMADAAGGCPAASGTGAAWSAAGEAGFSRRWGAPIAPVGGVVSLPSASAGSRAETRSRSPRVSGVRRGAGALIAGVRGDGTPATGIAAPRAAAPSLSRISEALCGVGTLITAVGRGGRPANGNSAGPAALTPAPSKAAAEPTRAPRTGGCGGPAPPTGRAGGSPDASPRRLTRTWRRGTPSPGDGGDHTTFCGICGAAKAASGVVAGSPASKPRGPASGIATPANPPASSSAARASRRWTTAKSRSGRSSRRLTSSRTAAESMRPGETARRNKRSTKLTSLSGPPAPLAAEGGRAPVTSPHSGPATGLVRDVRARRFRTRCSPPRRVAPGRSICTETHL